MVKGIPDYNAQGHDPCIAIKIMRKNSIREKKKKVEDREERGVLNSCSGAHFNFPTPDGFEDSWLFRIHA